MTVSTFFDQLFYTTVFLRGESNDGRAWSGTGFIYSEDHGEEGTTPILITNKHVLQGADRLTVRMPVAGEAGEPAPGRATQVTLHTSGDWWIGHPDPRVDIGVFGLAMVITRMTELGAAPFYRSVGRNLIPTDAQLNELDAIEAVMFVGYPAGLYDQHNSTPVVRQGITASRLQLAYEGLPAFLVDAAVFPGSSGSPVFLSNKALSASRSGAIQIGGRPAWLLGVLAAVHKSQVEGEIEELPAAFRVHVPQLLNLGIVYRSSAALECVDLLLSRAAAA